MPAMIAMLYEDLIYRPWTVPAHAEFLADTEMIEYGCNDNQKNVEHPASDEKHLAVTVVAGDGRDLRHDVLDEGIRLDFFRDHLIFHIVEGDMKATMNK